MIRNPFDNIKTISEYMTVANPKSILDIGIFNGKIGFIAREALEMHKRQYAYDAPWEIRIDGIEVCSKLIKPHIKALYSDIMVGEAKNKISTCPNYDLIVAENILPQYPKHEGWHFLDMCISHSNQFLIVSLEIGEAWKHHAIFRHPFDVRRSSWFLDDLKPSSIAHEIIHYPNYDYAIFLITKERYLKNRKEAFLSPNETSTEQYCPIREALSLNRESIQETDLSLLRKYIGNKESYRFFFSNNFTEHYQLLSYISNQFQQSLIFDVGTNYGYSALALSFNPSNKIVSYDIEEMRNILMEENLANIEFNIGNVLDDKRLLSSPLILLDTYHDGFFEKIFLEHLYKHQYKGILILDDIHLNTEMLVIWNGIDAPKEDITDLGHWSGTGIVHFI